MCIILLLNTTIPLLASLAKHLLAESVLGLIDRNSLHSLDKIVAHFLINHAILLIRLVLAYKVAQPLRRSPQSTIGPAADESKVLRKLTPCLNVHVQAVQVHFHERDETGEAAVVFAVDDFVHGHQLVIIRLRPCD